MRTEPNRHPRWRLAPPVRACFLALAVGFGSACPPAAAEPQQSSYLADVQIDMATLRKYADESDNYHLTWHSDGSLYGAYGDGWGFVRTDIPKRAIGVSRITGTPPNLAGVDVWEGDAQGQNCCWTRWNGKSWGMISTGASTCTCGSRSAGPDRCGFTEARLASSTDGGRSWTKANWAFTQAHGMLMPSFLQIGKAYTSSELPPEIMNYVYSYHARLVAHPGDVQTPGRIDLIRVPKSSRSRSLRTYEFFAGTDGTGAPIWSKDLNQRVPVLEKPHVLDAPPTVAWNPHLQRFIMVMGHVPVGDHRQARSRLLRGAPALGAVVQDQGDRPVRGGHDLLLSVPDQVDVRRQVSLDGVHGAGQAGRAGMGCAGRGEGQIRAGRFRPLGIEAKLSAIFLLLMGRQSD